MRGCARCVAVWCVVVDVYVCAWLCAARMRGTVRMRVTLYACARIGV